MKVLIIIIALLISFSIAANTLNAQQDSSSTISTLILKNGNILSGEIISQDDERLLIKISSDDNRTIEKEDIEDIELMTIGSSENSLQRLVLKDGSEITGTIESEDETNVYFRTHSGIDMIVPRSNISNIEKLRGEMVDGKFWRFDPNRTRLFITPTGKALSGGEGYFSVYELVFP